MCWVSLVLGMIATYWPVLGLLRMKSLTQRELKSLNEKKYRTINVQSFSHGLASILIAFLSVAGLMNLAIQKPIAANQLIPVALTVGVAILGFMDALFALRNGVYPAAKYLGPHTTYTYDEDGSLRQLARLHLLSTGACLGLGLTYWLIRWFTS